ncbi:endopeptidase IV (plasmid) [Legionella sp. PC1000]|uniref:tetratricopeptide repeat protein n=1 Tax=Legionella sp. PC1000 TaxID=2746060 RepID=UPI0015FD34E5|nr:SEL1-like repeat protein [Legionella sp. PC1000]QLZ70045.1 endopeptidase IV [Legionella sp. PC1000]QLZ70923.1 endopeptidase IV [Legionella sp. PC1000]
MKSLVPWVCLFVASAGQNVFADDFSAYRLGNYNKAIEPLMSQSGKNAVADYYLGRIYLYGYGQLKNSLLAIRYFTQSAQKGYLPAIQLMAKYTLLHDKDPQQAFTWFKKAADAGDVDAQMFTAAAYMYGVGVKKNMDAATRYYINAAKNGNSIAQFTLAKNFIESRNASNRKLGLIWLNKAVANNNPQAITRLGELYLEGKMLDKDENKGEQLLNQAAAQGFAPAMVALGELALEQNQKEQALQWFNKAGNQQNNEAYLDLAHIYLQQKSPVYDPKTAYMWTLKAAQNGLPQAKRELAEMYQKGIGVEVAPDLAKQWLNQAMQDESAKNQEAALAQAALWLSNGTTDKLEQTDFQMKGILSAWHNPMVLGDFAYNQGPQLKKMMRQSVFHPQFELVQPNDVPITSYYDALLSKTPGFQANQWTYPHYPLDHQLSVLERINTPIYTRINLPTPYIDANFYDYDDNSQAHVMDLWTQDWQAQLNYMSVFNHLYFRAILGDAQSQFQIGQMFQYGIGVGQSDSSAIIFYQNAAQQQHLGAEYNLAILYLQHAKDKKDYQLALNDLTDAAFKGNKRSQYVLARILSQGITGPDGTVYIQPNQEQATSMLYLAAANNYGPAEYELADSLARQNDSGLSVDVRKQKIAMIRQLYQGAADRGVSQALLPLAYYNAMDQDKQRQAQAFLIAKDEAATGNEHAALLMGLLYDRGIGVKADPGQAITWYQQAGQNAVSNFILGTYASEGKGIAQDKTKGMEQLQQSVDDQFSYADFNIAVLQKETGQDFLPNLIRSYKLGNSHAGIVLADYYLAENSDPEKMQEAKQIYTGLAEKGDQYAQLKLAYMLENGLGSEPDLAGAQRWYTASAEQGNPLAQYQLGQFYQLGENAEPDYNLAKQWYEKAAATLPEASVALGFIDETVNDNYVQALKAYEQAAMKGDALGIYDLALMYLYGKGTPVNYQKARDLFVEAATHQVHEAMNQLGALYFNGLGQPRDTQQALSWYKKAAELGNANALYQLGLLSETGFITKLDFNNALNYYQQSADKGNEKAMLALARMYHYGLGVEKNPKMAAGFYEKLAARQNAYAQYQLGTYYLEGTVGERSLSKGKELLQQASDNGSLQARKALQRMEAQTQARVSFIEPILINKVPVIAGQTADFMYLQALNEWNQGDEILSRMILQRLVTQYPNFIPAKRAFDQLNQIQKGSIFG